MTLVPTAKYVSTVAVIVAPATTFAGDVVNVPLLTAIRRLANVSLLPMAKIWCGPLVVVTGTISVAEPVPVPEATTLASGVNDVSREYVKSSQKVTVSPDSKPLTDAETELPASIMGVVSFQPASVPILGAKGGGSGSTAAPGFLLSASILIVRCSGVPGRWTTDRMTCEPAAVTAALTGSDPSVIRGSALEALLTFGAPRFSHATRVTTAVVPLVTAR